MSYFLAEGVTSRYAKEIIQKSCEKISERNNNALDALMKWDSIKTNFF